MEPGTTEVDSNDFTLHMSSSSFYLYGFNVLFAYISYLSVFAEAFMIPF